MLDFVLQDYHYAGDKSFSSINEYFNQIEASNRLADDTYTQFMPDVSKNKNTGVNDYKIIDPIQEAITYSRAYKGTIGI
jgi:hypothetical protein